MEAVHGNVGVDGIKVKVHRWTGIFWTGFILSECVSFTWLYYGNKQVSHWRTFPCLTL